MAWNAYVCGWCLHACMHSPSTQPRPHPDSSPPCQVWTLTTARDSKTVAIGYDDGTVVLKLGSEVPIASMEKNGKVLW